MQPQGSVPLLQAPPRLRPARQPRLHLGDWDLSSRSEFTPGSSCCPRASGPCNLEPVPLPYPSLPPPLHSSNFFFPPSLNFTHPSARLLHSSHPIGGPHPWRGPAPCPPGANPPRACRVLGRSPERPASDGSAPGAAGGAGGRAGGVGRRGRGKGRGGGGACGGFESGSFLAARAGVGLRAPAPQRRGHLRSRDRSVGILRVPDGLFLPQRFPR